jgi:hypothetical protein
MGRRLGDESRQKEPGRGHGSGDGAQGMIPSSRMSGALGRCSVAAVLTTSLACGPRTEANAAGQTPLVPASVATVRVTPWREDARAAYSLIHDDLCAGASGILAHAVPELRARGLRAGLATVAGSCEQAGISSQLQALAADGFEIVNHSYSHPHLTPDLAPREIFEARRLLESYAHAPVTFFAFPYDEYNDATIALVQGAGHLGARAGGGGVNAADFPDPLRAKFEGYGPYSAYGTGPASLDRYVDAALAAGGWALRECHGVQDESWEPVPLDGYRAHLERVRGQVDDHQLWMAPPSTVVRYRLRRQSCGAPSVDGSRVTFGPSEACSASSTDLTIAVALTAKASGVVVRAGDRELPARQNAAGEWVVTIDPRIPSELFASAP